MSFLCECSNTPSHPSLAESHVTATTNQHHLSPPEPPPSRFFPRHIHQADTFIAAALRPHSNLCQFLIFRQLFVYKLEWQKVLYGPQLRIL